MRGGTIHLIADLKPCHAEVLFGIIFEVVHCYRELRDMIYLFPRFLKINYLQICLTRVVLLLFFQLKNCNGKYKLACQLNKFCKSQKKK